MRAHELLQAPPQGADIVVSAPGRANLIGDWTDVNEGFVLPVGLELRTVLAGRRSPDRLMLRSQELPEDGVVEVDLRTGSGPRAGWGRYATAVVAALLEAGLAIQGFEGVVASDVPIGSGLSSSAALEVAVALALVAEPVDLLTLAKLCQRAENHGVGVQSGIMDQLSSAASRAGHALFLDCRDLSSEHIPFPSDLAVLVVDCAVSRSLSAVAYNERRQQCAEAARVLGVASLRDATEQTLAQGRTELGDRLHRRARHVVTENARVIAAAHALRKGDLPELGRLFAASHDSLARDFEVSVPELDLLVGAATTTPGVHASRLTGAGFGGCTVSLVNADGAELVRDEVLARYAAASGLVPRGWISAAAEGASIST